MTPNNHTTAAAEFSNEEIYEELKKIFLHPVFKNADILKRFLEFIVEQTLTGHENWIKEYTIAVSVLNKPKDFNPVESGIVRIHAGRLRRALNQYYQQNGMTDPIHISVSKGGYVPVFNKNTGEIQPDSQADAGSEKMGVDAIVAVVPFTNMHSELQTTFTEGLCCQLSTALTGFENLAVVPFQIMRNLFKRTDDIKEVASIVEANYMITGDVQSARDKLRVSVQTINTGTNTLVWGRIFDKRLTETNALDLQDEITQLIQEALRIFFKGNVQSINLHYKHAIA
jgi:TolB-like protein